MEQEVKRKFNQYVNREKAEERYQVRAIRKEGKADKRSKIKRIGELIKFNLPIKGKGKERVTRETKTKKKQIKHTKNSTHKR